MTAATFKSNNGDHKVCKKKNLSWFFNADRKICPSISLPGITRKSLVMTNSNTQTHVSIRTSHPYSCIDLTCYKTDLFCFYYAANVTFQYWFLEMHSLPMADELRSFQFLEISEAQ